MVSKSAPELPLAVPVDDGGKVIVDGAFAGGDAGRNDPGRGMGR
jgi:hypothetical protein